MVATRSGVLVSSPSKSDSDHTGVAQATPSTGRRTRRTAKAPESPSRSTVEEASSQLEKIAEGSPPSCSARKRCTRASRLHSPEKPCTPLGSVHGGDLSDVDSCCSAVSDVKAPLVRRSTRRLPRTIIQEDDVSEVESCSSAVSAPRPGVRRSTRKKKITNSSDSDKIAPKTASRMTRNQIIDSEVSDVDSVSEDVAKSSTRRTTRSRRQLRAIPIHLEESSESSQSPAPTARRTRAARGRAAASKLVSEPQSCDSEGFESGPNYSKSKLTESDSDCTPSSSRTRSGVAILTKDVSIVLEKAIVQPDEEASLNDSRLQSTIIAEDAESTLLEEEKEEHSDITPTETNQELESSLEKEKEYEDISPDPILVLDEVTAEEPAVMAEGQQEEPSSEGMVDNNLEIMQETVQAPERSQPLQSASVTTTCEPQIIENSVEAMEVVDVLDDKKLDAEGEDDDHMPGGDKVDESSVCAEAQQVVDSIQGPSPQMEQHQDEPIQATSSQEQPDEGAVLQSKNIITLLDSSEEEDDDDDDDDKYADGEGDSSGDEESLETAGEDWCPKKPDVTKIVDGLFMIDTRPGQEADEDYYKGETREEDKAPEEEAAEEEEETFVDEEGEDDDDVDEGADILFSSRNRHSQELSSRIDPGIRMKDLGGLYISFDGSKPVSSSQQKLKEKKIQDEVMKKSIIGPDFEKKEAVPPYKESKRTLKLKRRAEREKTTGDAWFNMKAPEITQELKGDLQLLRMRGSMDSKRFYKKNDRDGFPKYFQMGTVVDNPVDFYHSRVPKKGRKRTMVEELLTDAEFRHKNKKKFQSIMTEKAAQASGRRRKMKNKFHKKQI